MTTLSVEKLSETVGAELVGLEAERLLTDDSLPDAIRTALEEHGVLVFRGLRLDPETQVSFCRRIGQVELFTGSHPVQGIFRVTLDPAKNPAADYLRGTFDWHIDGCTPARDEFPQMATVLSACVVAEKGGETEFASTYVAYDNLSDGREGALGAAPGGAFPGSLAAARHP